MNYFKTFFEELIFFKALETKGDNKSERLHCYLKDPSNIIFQQEIDKWLKIAYEQSIVGDFKKRLSGNVTFISLQCVLNELMAAYFMKNKLGLGVKEYSPSVKGNKMADWLIETNNQEVYVEVKTPWEERKIGTFFYSQYDKLFEAIRKKYNQRPEDNTPFIINITDELNITPAIYHNEIEDALYGKRAIVFHKFSGRTLEQPSYEVVDRRSIFQWKIRRNLSAVIILKLIVWFDPEKLQDVGKYHFVLYHNPYCHEECRLNPDWFKPFRQYVPNFEKGEMEWIADIISINCEDE